jgi:hypothetical protein
MENAHTKESDHSFLTDRKAKEVFARVDYFLRSGVHFQRENPKPEELFRFIERNYISLATYYFDFFKLALVRSGEEFTSRYYYLDLDEENNRASIPSDHRFKKTMDTAHIIIGMLYLKIYKLDGNIELDTVSDFVQILFTEYDEQKKGLFALIASAKNEKITDYLEKDVIKEIRDAFAEFEKIGWIVWDDENKNKFSYMPSFERLRKKYQAQILSMDELIQKLSNDQ